MQDDAVFLAALRASMAAPDALLTEHQDMQAYERGERYGAGRAIAVARPRTTEEARAVIAACVRHGRALVAQGANTGLVAASTPDASGTQVVLSTRRMKAILSVDPTARTAHVSAGVLLSELNAAASRHNLFFPIDLGADPSIGGMVSANTGGSRLIRYGDVRRNVLGLKAVLPGAEAAVLDLNSALRKNNTGPDLKQLFIGTAGALGVVTEAIVALVPQPMQQAVALVGLEKPEDALALYESVDARLHDFASAFEGLSRRAMEFALAHVPQLASPFPGGLPPYAVLVEISSSLPASSGLVLDDLLAECLYQTEGITLGETVLGRPEQLWAIRHSLTEGARHSGKVIAMDLCLPRSRLFEFREKACAWLSRSHPGIDVADFGHIGDGGMHFNLVCPKTRPITDTEIGDIRGQAYEMAVREFGGSFSAEHGLGPYNQDYYDRFTTPESKLLGGALKSMLDPSGALGSFRFGAPP
jgi:FAD/FMN-containing dehydrogenase